MFSVNWPCNSYSNGPWYNSTQPSQSNSTQPSESSTQASGQAHATASSTLANDSANGGAGGDDGDGGEDGDGRDHYDEEWDYNYHGEHCNCDYCIHERTAFIRNPRGQQFIAVLRALATAAANHGITSNPWLYLGYLDICGAYADMYNILLRAGFGFLLPIMFDGFSDSLDLGWEQLLDALNILIERLDPYYSSDNELLIGEGIRLDGWFRNSTFQAPRFRIYYWLFIS